MSVIIDALQRKALFLSFFFLVVVTVSRSDDRCRLLEICSRLCLTDWFLPLYPRIGREWSPNEQTDHLINGLIGRANGSNSSGEIFVLELYFQFMYDVTYNRWKQVRAWRRLQPFSNDVAGKHMHLRSWLQPFSSDVAGKHIHLPVMIATF